MSSGIQGEGLTPREILELMLGHLGFVFEIEEIRNDDHLLLNVRTRDPARLIGRDGRTLEDLQYLLNRTIDGASESGPGSRVIVDVEGHRQKEQQDFLTEVRERAERVKRGGAPETLPPMNAYERWPIHQAFKDDPDVRTRSVEGAGRLKQIVIELRS